MGDTLEEGDIIAQVETDKAVMDMETPSEGYLAKIIVPAGTKEIPLGKVGHFNVNWELWNLFLLLVTCNYCG